MKDSRKRTIIIAAELIIIGILFVAIGFNELKRDKKVAGSSQTEVVASGEVGLNSEGVPGSAVTQKDAEVTEAPAEPTLTPEEQAELDRLAAEEAERLERERKDAEIDEILSVTDIKAAMYDYDAAIAEVQAFEGYETEERLTEAIAAYEEKKAALVKWPDNTTISHLFVHSLIVDTSRAFAKGSSEPVGYNRYMTTVDEFNKILEQMYAKGYVLISVHDMAERVIGEDGTEKLVAKEIWLPEGKTPFVLSQDDVNYYLYMQNDGFAERLVVGEDGIPTCEYIEKDGTVVYGEYDVVPIVDRFVREHPDFSYRGRKGILAVTGYEGALGYDTGLSMKKYNDMDETEKMKLIEAEREKATAVAEALKADGWEFASHSYTHTSMTTNTVNKVSYDLKRWKEEVQCILGDTDIYIYPFGADICDWRGYSGEKFDLMREYGFWYFCNVDSARYWVQIREGYFRQGRINADGERMVKTPDKLVYFFDVDSVFDPTRPELKF